jgi:hypothetical protein
MKLLYCGHCGDIVLLFLERRSCKCGRSWGQYLEDRSTTVQTECSLSLGFANADFWSAIKSLLTDRQANRSGFSPLLCFRAWINPDSEPDVKYLPEDQATGSAVGEAPAVSQDTPSAPSA